MEMALQIQDKNAVVKGTPIVEPSNKFFWFNRPQWILFLIHLTLFQVGAVQSPLHILLKLKVLQIMIDFDLSLTEILF